MRHRVLRHLIWVYTVCSGLSVPIHMLNTVWSVHLFSKPSALTFTTIWTISADNKFLFFPPRKRRFDISSKLSPMETICMKCQILFFGKNKKTRQSAQWGTYTPDQHYRQFLTSTKYVALTLEMAGWMNSMLIAISPKPLGRITKFNKRFWWYSYINLDAIFFTFIWYF